VRSLLAGAAAVWSIIQATSFLPTPFVLPNEGQVGGIDGDAGAVAVTWGVRAIFVAIALISLALLEWHILLAPFRREPDPAA
jgi:hypothetical protein